MAANTHSLDLEASSSQYLSIADASQTGLDFSTTFTIGGWFRPESLPANGAYMGLLGKDTDGNRSYSLWLYNNAGTYRLEAYVFNTGSYDAYYANVTASTGNWYHWAVSCNVANASATTFVFYEAGASLGNGTMVANNNISSISNTAGPFLIGTMYTAGSNLFDGMVDELFATSDVLLDAEVDALYDGYTPTGAGIDNVKAYWQLNNALTDASGNGNTLSASGSPSFSTTVPFANYDGEIPATDSILNLTSKSW